MSLFPPLPAAAEQDRHPLGKAGDLGRSPCPERGRQSGWACVAVRQRTGPWAVMLPTAPAFFPHHGITISFPGAALRTSLPPPPIRTSPPAPPISISFPALPTRTSSP